MKTGGARGERIRGLIDALEGAGYQLVRRSSSHFIMRSSDPDRPQVTVPQKLDDPIIARRIARIAGVAL